MDAHSRCNVDTGCNPLTWHTMNGLVNRHQQNTNTCVEIRAEWCAQAVMANTCVEIRAEWCAQAVMASLDLRARGTPVGLRRLPVLATCIC